MIQGHDTIGLQTELGQAVDEPEFCSFFFGYQSTLRCTKGWVDDRTRAGVTVPPSPKKKKEKRSATTIGHRQRRST